MSVSRDVVADRCTYGTPAREHYDAGSDSAITIDVAIGGQALQIGPRRHLEGA